MKNHCLFIFFMSFPVNGAPHNKAGTYSRLRLYAGCFIGSERYYQAPVIR